MEIKKKKKKWIQELNWKTKRNKEIKRETTSSYTTRVFIRRYVSYFTKCS